MNETDIALEYQNVLARCDKLGNTLPEITKIISKDWSEGRWKMYFNLIMGSGITIENRVVLDFGCKFGHIIPLLRLMKAKKVIGIDSEKYYIDGGKALFESLYSDVKLIMSSNGLIPLQPESVDIVIMNEVISHINPAYLNSLLLEISRILTPGGILFISDGNNLAGRMTKEKLVDLYEKWENGPEGARTDRDIVLIPYIERRKKIIRERCPSISDDKTNSLAQNTSFLFGEQLMDVLDQYMTTGTFVKRPYRTGICPVEPYTGVVMERGFYPELIVLMLKEYGFSSKQIIPLPIYNNSISHKIRKSIRIFSNIVRMKFMLQGQGENLQIIAIKEF